MLFRLKNAGLALCLSVFFSHAHASPWYAHEATGLTLPRNMGNFIGAEIRLSSKRECGERCGDYVYYKGDGCTASLALPRALEIRNLPPEFSSVRLDIAYKDTKRAVLAAKEIWKSAKLSGEKEFLIGDEGDRIRLPCFYAEFEHKDGQLRSGARCFALLGEYLLSIALTCAKGTLSPAEQPPSFAADVAKAAVKARQLNRAPPSSPVDITIERQTVPVPLPTP